MAIDEAVVLGRCAGTYRCQANGCHSSHADGLPGKYKTEDNKIKFNRTLSYAHKNWLLISIPFQGDSLPLGKTVSLHFQQAVRTFLG